MSGRLRAVKLPAGVLVDCHRLAYRRHDRVGRRPLLQITCRAGLEHRQPEHDESRLSVARARSSRPPSQGIMRWVTSTCASRLAAWNALSVYVVVVEANGVGHTERVVVVR